MRSLAALGSRRSAAAHGMAATRLALHPRAQELLLFVVTVITAASLAANTAELGFTADQLGAARISDFAWRAR